ncbi:hypothetical protein BBP40_007221 [Aspergillus hancockii]|nr:hypothetical protein BBP40_007221 [Aspergillus hancockii]
MGRIQLVALEILVGNVKELIVLELACDLGFFSKKAIEWGTSKVVGLDISPTMITTARACTTYDNRIDFHVADCSQPIDFGQFDIILAPWLLNLKPGGRLAGISPNVHVLENMSAFPQGYRFGQELNVLGEAEDGGLEVQVTFHPSTPFSFSNYYLSSTLYEKCCMLAGMRDFQ